MARTETFANLKTRTLREADKESDTFIDSTTEIGNVVNMAVAELYDILIDARGEGYYEKGAPSTFSTVAGTGTYNLPTDFYRLTKLQLQISSRWLNLDPYMHGEDDAWIPVSRVYSARLYYAPYCPLLVNAGDTFDGINGWEEYAVVRGAIVLREKAEEDTSGLWAQLQHLRKRIDEMKRGRDQRKPFRVVDALSPRRDRLWYRYASTPIPMYRLKNGVVEIIEPETLV